MHMLYILLLALGIYSSVGLIQVGQTSSASPCQIKLPFTNSHISAFYEQTILGTGCVTNQTTKNNQEVHVINLKKTGPVYRNDVAEVHLFVKSRNDEVLWEPLIIVLNSIDPVKWRVRTEILAPARKKHLFVVPAYSSVKLVKGNSRRMVRRVDQMSQNVDKLHDWVLQRFGAVTSFSELDKGNQITLHVGPEKSASSVCKIVEGDARNVEASYEQPQLLSGCMMHPKTTIMDRLAYVIELGNVDPNPNKKTSVDVELEIKGRNKRTTHKNLLLVLKSPNKVTWRIKTRKLQGYAEIVSNSHIDMSGIKMDPVSERIEEFTDSGEKFLKWVEEYIGQVAIYTSITLANKIKLVIPDTEERPKTPPEKPAILINPFENVQQTKQYFLQNARATCLPQGVLRVSLSKAVLKTFKLNLNQISLNRPSCIATQNATHILLESSEDECGTRRVMNDGQTYLFNSILIHQSSAEEALETGSGDYYDDMDEEEVDGSGNDAINRMTETRIDDEDFHKVDIIRSDVSCLQQKEDPIIVNSSHTPDDKPYRPNITNVIPPPSWAPDVNFELQIYKTPLYLEPYYVFPADVGIKSRVYVNAGIVGDKSLRAQIVSCNIIQNHRNVQPLIHEGCKTEEASWEPVPTGKPFMGSVTQSQRFSFNIHRLTDFMNQYIYVSCHLTVCRNYLTKQNTNIPQCVDNKKQICEDGLPKISPGVPFVTDITKGPLNIVPGGSPVNHVTHSQSEIVKSDVTEKPQSTKTDAQSVVVDGLESGTVIGIAFAAFFIGVLLMAALWFIHTNTGPLKHAVASGRAGIEGTGESTPMSTAPITINS